MSDDWVGGDGSWEDPDHWTLRRPPVGGEVVNINNAASVTVNTAYDAAHRLAGVNINDVAVTLTFDHNANVFDTGTGITLSTVAGAPKLELKMANANDTTQVSAGSVAFIAGSTRAGFTLDVGQHLSLVVSNDVDTKQFAVDTYVHGSMSAANAFFRGASLDGTGKVSHLYDYGTLTVSNSLWIGGNGNQEALVGDGGTLPGTLAAKDLFISNLASLIFNKNSIGTITGDTHVGSPGPGFTPPDNVIKGTGALFTVQDAARVTAQGDITIAGTWTEAPKLTVMSAGFLSVRGTLKAGPGGEVSTFRFNFASGPQIKVTGQRSQLIVGNTLDVGNGYKTGTTVGRASQLTIDNGANVRLAAFLGLTQVWARNYDDPEYEPTEILIIDSGGSLESDGDVLIGIDPFGAHQAYARVRVDDGRLISHSQIKFGDGKPGPRHVLEAASSTYVVVGPRGLISIDGVVSSIQKQKYAKVSGTGILRDDTYRGGVHPARFICLGTGADIAPGSPSDPFGTLTIDGDLDASSGMTLDVAMNGGASSKLAVTGNVDWEGALADGNLSDGTLTWSQLHVFAQSVPDPNTSFTILSAGSFSYNFLHYGFTDFPWANTASAFIPGTPEVDTGVPLYTRAINGTALGLPAGTWWILTVDSSRQNLQLVRKVPVAPVITTDQFAAANALQLYARTDILHVQWDPYFTTRLVLDEQRRTNFDGTVAQFTGNWADADEYWYDGILNDADPNNTTFSISLNVDATTRLRIRQWGLDGGELDTATLSKHVDAPDPAWFNAEVDTGDDGLSYINFLSESYIPNHWAARDQNGPFPDDWNDVSSLGLDYFGTRFAGLGGGQALLWSSDYTDVADLWTGLGAGSGNFPGPLTVTPGSLPWQFTLSGWPSGTSVVPLTALSDQDCHYYFSPPYSADSSDPMQIDVETTDGTVSKPWPLGSIFAAYAVASGTNYHSRLSNFVDLTVPSQPQIIDMVRTYDSANHPVIGLQWSDASDNELRFEVQRGIMNTETSIDWVTVGTPTTASYVDNYNWVYFWHSFTGYGLQYRVRAVRTVGGESVASYWTYTQPITPGHSSLTINSVDVPTTAPSGTFEPVTINWTNTDLPVDKLFIEIKEDSNIAPTNYSTILEIDPDPNTGLLPTSATIYVPVGATFDVHIRGRGTGESVGAQIVSDSFTFQSSTWAPGYDGGFVASVDPNDDHVYVSWPHEGFDSMDEGPAPNLSIRSAGTPLARWIGINESPFADGSRYTHSADSWDLGPVYMLAYGNDANGNPAQTFQIAADFGNGDVQVFGLWFPNSATIFAKEYPYGVLSFESDGYVYLDSNGYPISNFFALLFDGGAQYFTDSSAAYPTDNVYHSFDRLGYYANLVIYDGSPVYHGVQWYDFSVALKPLNVQAVSTGEGVQISWEDDADNESGFEIQYFDGANWNYLAAVGPDTTTYLDPLAAGAAHGYRIRANRTDANLDSDWSDPVTVTV